jgi:hypothetical protein
MRILVVDNESEETLRLWDYLKEAFPDATILPERTPHTLPIFNDWEEVHNFVKNIEDERAVLCLDLALKTGKVDFQDVERGLNQGAALRQLKPNWVILAYTMHGQRATLFPAYKEAFHGMIDKAILDSMLDRDERILFVKNMVKTAVKKCASEKGQDIFPTTARIVDSLGMRLFRAVFGDVAINEIIENEASLWRSVELRALTTGHSGAFLLSIRGTFDNRPQSIALKVARDEHIIQAEVDAPSKYIGELGPLNGRLGFFDPKKKRLATAGGLYYRQALENGKQLIELLPGRNRKASEKILAPVVRLCIDVAKSVPGRCGNVIANEKFKLFPIDISRLESSALFVAELGDTLLSQGYWPTSTAEPEELTAEVTELAKTWNGSRLTSLTLRTVLQHGDLNPGNVLIREDQDGVPILIDLSRLGQWPIGYDLCRLALMLRLRLMDAHKQADWLPDGLVRWAGEPVAYLNGDEKSHPVLCLEAKYCDFQFKKFLEGVTNPENKKLMAYGYKLGTLWDLIKIVSYQDVSVFKRVWAFIEAWKLKRTLTHEIENL